MEHRAYYKAYDDRYKQVHREALRWFSCKPSPIVAEVISAYNLAPTDRMLEIGCGEGRDAGFLLSQGFDVLATDVSGEAVAYCRKLFPDYRECFKVLDCVREKLDERFDFIYAIAVIHMLVPDEDRDGLYQFIFDHLKPGGIALIGTMGDGNFETRSDVSAAFDLQERRHEASGKTLKIAGTSCRVVNFSTFEQELTRNGFAILGQGVTSVEPDFPQMMYAVVKQIASE